MRQISLVTDPPVRSASLHFAAGIPGFPHLHTFTLGTWGGDESPFLTMTADQDPDIGFVVVSPFLYYPEYEFELDNATAERLGVCAAARPQIRSIAPPARTLPAHRRESVIVPPPPPSSGAAPAAASAASRDASEMRRTSRRR